MDKLLKEQNVLFFTRTMGLGGTENVVLQLCEILNDKVNKIVVCSTGGLNENRLKELGVKHYIIPDITVKKPANIIKLIIFIYRVVTKEKISIIHTHHRMAAFYVSLMRLYRRCYFINTCHNTFEDKIKLTRFAYKHCNLIACGEEVKKNLCQVYGLHNEQIITIHNAVSPFEEDIIEEPIISKLKKEGMFVVGNIGRLSKQKGMEYYIKAIPLILKKHKNVRFFIIGTGEDKENLENLSKKLGTENYLTFLGYRCDVQNIISQLDLVVLSSLWEGLPLTPIETFSVGKTIVATKVDGTVEIVDDGNTGLLVNEKNYFEIAEAVNFMIENPSIRKNMENNAKEKYLEEFTDKVYEKNIIHFYNEVLGNGK